jgi:hypothetical protein
MVTVTGAVIVGPPVRVSYEMTEAGESLPKLFPRQAGLTKLRMMRILKYLKSRGGKMNA